MEDLKNSHKNRRDFFIFILILVLVFIMAARSPIDSDLFWHLATGKVTLAGGGIVTEDVFSFTRFGSEWINHSWLSQVILFSLYHLGGMGAIGLLVAIGATLIAGMVYLQMSGAPIFRAFIIVLGSLVLAPVWTPRPQLFSLIFFAGLGLYLHRVKWSGWRKFYLIPIIFCLWGNLHGGFVLGLMMVGAFIAGEVGNRVFHLEKDSYPVLNWKEIGTLTGWTIASIPALAINPNGFNTLTIPFQTVGVGSLQQFINEWASPDFHDLVAQPYLWLFLLVLVAIGWCGKRVDGVDLASMALFGYAGFMAQRNFGPFAIVAMPIISRYLWLASVRWLNLEIETIAKILDYRKGFPVMSRRRWQRKMNLALIGLFGVIAFVKVAWVNMPAIIQLESERVFPVRAVTWIRNYQPDRHLLSEYNWGGYLILDLPEYPVFVDGRTDLFGDEIIGEWMGLVSAAEGWQQSLSNRNIHTVLLMPEREILARLLAEGWKIGYQDELAVVLVKP